MVEPRRLPLFPLNVVLFPGMLLPLHIFEARYQEMIRRCMVEDRTFGVCLIRSGDEVGGPAEPYEVGTTCEILKLTELGGGRLDLVTLGRERFIIDRLYHELSYLEGDICPIPEGSAYCPEALIQEVREATTEYVGTLLSQAAQPARRLELPDDAATLSNLVASILLQVPADIRQDLLEAPNPRERLESELALLRALTTDPEEHDGAVIARPLRMKPSYFNPN
jgi:Lon protease-like protein